MKDFFSEISEFLKAHEIEFTTKTIGGISFIHYKGEEHEISLLPIAIEAKSLEEAEEKQQAYKRVLESLQELIIITEDRWRKAGKVFQKRILSHMERHIPIYARNCEVKRIDKNTAAAFMDENHSYGSATCKYSYGLFLKRYTGHIVAKQGGLKFPELGNLIAVAQFSAARNWLKNGENIKSYEWVRYASLPSIRVSGGMGKMLKAFIEDVRPDDIMSYADLEWSMGEVYKDLGFEREEDKKPIMFIIFPQTWERQPISKAKDSLKLSKTLFYKNFGSAKYRLKLKDY